MLKDELDRKNREADVPILTEEQIVQEEAKAVWNTVQRLIKESWYPGVTLKIEAGCYNGGVFWEAHYYRRGRLITGKFGNKLIMYTRKYKKKRWFFYKKYQLDGLIEFPMEVFEAVMKIARENGIEASKAEETRDFHFMHEGELHAVVTSDFYRFTYYPTKE